MQIAVKKQESDSGSPLDRLAALLDNDMKQVNTVILENMQSNVPLIPQVASYLIASGGKRLRPLLTLASTRLFGYDGARPFGLAASVEFIHTATLLHDDVVDGSKERRGKQAANLVFGNQASVLVGDFLFSRAFQLMVADGSLDILGILSNAAAIIAEGEVLQLSAANDINTSYNDYEEIIKSKTAALFAAACEIGPIIAGQPEHAKAMYKYGLNLGIAFQIADDVLDYNADQEKLGKTVGDDFREGKVTAPVIIALKNASDEERAFWQRTIGDTNQTKDDLSQAQEILTKHDALAQSSDLAIGYSEKARNALTGIPVCDMRACLEDIAAFTVERGH